MAKPLSALDRFPRFLVFGRVEVPAWLWAAAAAARIRWTCCLHSKRVLYAIAPNAFDHHTLLKGKAKVQFL